MGNPIKKLTEMDQFTPLNKIVGCPKPETLQDAILAVYRQKDIPIGMIANDLVSTLVRLYKPDLKCLGLVSIGGEGFIVHVQDDLKFDMALKIAYPMEAKNEGQRSVLHWSSSLRNGYEVQTTDIASQRFVEGTKLQNSLWHQLLPPHKEKFYIPRIIGACKEPVIIEMEWAFGDTFKTWITSKPTMLDRLLYFRNLLEGVLFTHERGVIHRDLKPENLIFGENYRVTIVDWTLAKKANDDKRNLTVKGTMLGSPAYASPQQLQDAKDATYQDDIFYLGFTLAAFILGSRMPTPINTKDSLYQRKAKFRKLILDMKLDFPHFFHQAFSKATEIYPEERYLDVGEFIENIDDLIYQLQHTKEGQELCKLPDTKYPQMTFNPNDERNIPTIITPKVETTPVSPVEKIENVKELVDELTEIMVMRCRLKNKTCLGNCTNCTNKILNRTMITLVVETIDELKKRNKI